MNRLDHIDIKKDTISRREVREVMKRWHNTEQLGQHRLATLSIVTRERFVKNYHSTNEGYGQALQDVLYRAIEIIKAHAKEGDINDEIWRYYVILTERYIQRSPSHYVMNQLALGTAMYYEIQSKALDAIARILFLWERHQTEGEMLASAEFYPIGTDLPHTIPRYPDVSLRDKVALSQRCILRVAVTQRPLRKELEEYAMDIKVPPGAKSAEITVLVTAEDFEIVGDDYQSMIVPVDSDSKPLIFHLKAQSLGEKKVKVEFFQDGRYIGGITTQTTVVLPDELELIDAKQIDVSGFIGLEQSLVPAPDLTLLITESKSSDDLMRYKFKLHSPANGLFYYTVREYLQFSGSPSKWMEGLYNELEQLGEYPEPESVAETLSAIGSDLYEKLFPHELKEIWTRQIRGNVKHILILSDEPWVPWELIKPFHEDEINGITEDGFLCEDYRLARWIAGPPPQSKIQISNCAFIAPVATNIPSAQQEITFLKDALKGQSAVTEITPQLAPVRQLLREGGYELIHFACHGTFEPAEHEQSKIYLEGNDIFRSRDITGAGKNFGRNKPFVFINACQTARADFSLVGIGSWADKFINAKSSGFLGSSWGVNDEIAYRFSQVFYTQLIQGETVGEAMHAARLAVKDEPNATWLAYTLYADPLARVTFLKGE